MASGGGFGPVGPVAGGAPPFTVTGATQVGLDASRAGVASFAVSNVTGRPVRSRITVVPGAGADAAWFQVVGESERPLPVAGNATVDVRVAVPDTAAAGAYSFALTVALEDAPEQVVSGPTVAFTVPEAKKKRFPWWIVIVAAVALVLLVGGGLTVFFLTRPDPEPTESPSPSEPPVHSTGAFAVDHSPINVDLDNVVLEGVGRDVIFNDPDQIFLTLGFPMKVTGAAGGVAVVDEGGFEICRDAPLIDSVDVPDVPGVVLICTRTSDDRVALIEVTTGPSKSSVRQVSFTVFE